MASQVFTGVGNFSQTNNTGQNVRVFISYMEEKFISSSSPSAADVLQLSWGNVTTTSNTSSTVLRGPISSTDFTYIVADVSSGGGRTIKYVYGLPYEIMLKPLETFSAKNCGVYNLAFIPEDVPNGSLASQVLSNSSSLSYTNNTGRNVRLVINYMQLPGGGSNQFTLGGTALSGLSTTIQFITKNKMQLIDPNGVNVSNYLNISKSVQFLLAPGQSFTANCLAYNVVAIPE